MLKLCVYIPAESLESVKAAIFGAGAGQLGEYSECCWQVLGTGQFKPSSHANPAIGERQQITQVAEYRLECLVDEHCAGQVVSALIAAHPYEEPAYDFVSLVAIDPA